MIKSLISIKRFYNLTFQRENGNLKESLQTHLINLDQDGVLQNNYEKLFTTELNASVGG